MPDCSLPCLKRANAYTAGAAARMDEDATAILQVHNGADDTAAQVQQSPTLSLQLNRGTTQHTVAEQPFEDTQENEGVADKPVSTASQVS